MSSNTNIVIYGKLLHVAPLRKMSAHALLGLLKSKEILFSTETCALIVKQFNGLRYSSLIPIFMKFISHPSWTRNELDYNTTEYAVYYASLIVMLLGGLDELIELHKKVAEDPKVRWTGGYHLGISKALMEYAATNKLSIDKLVEIIPFGWCKYNPKMQPLKNAITESGPINLDQASLNRIKLANQQGEFTSTPNECYIYRSADGSSGALLGQKLRKQGLLPQLGGN